MKRFSAIVFMLLLCIQIPVLGATKQELLGAVRGSVTVAGVTRTVPESYIKEFAEMLNRNDFTGAELDQVMGYIQAGKSYWVSTGEPYFSKMDPSQQDQLMSILNSAISILDVKVSSNVESQVEVTQNKDGDVTVGEDNQTQVSVDLVDKLNNHYPMIYGVNGTLANPVKVTGMGVDYRPMAICFSAIFLLFVCTGVYLNGLKRQESANEEE